MNSDAVIRCNSATEFLNSLQQLLLEERKPEIASRFVFRGQGDASWRLVPSALRYRTILGHESRRFARRVSESPAETWNQANAEFVALMEFLNLAVKVGLDIPVDYRWLRQWNPFKNVVGDSIGIADWPPQDLLQALALAQHHGVPTRLLDFSYDPLIAAYFAGEDPHSAAKEIAVWCVDVQVLLLAARDSVPRVQFVTVPNFLNRNLAAQKGLFLLDLYASRQSYALEDNIGGEHLGTCAVKKFCLPSTLGERSCEYPRKLGVDRAHLMPSFDGVVNELRTRQKNLEMGRIPWAAASNQYAMTLQLENE